MFRARQRHPAAVPADGRTAKVGARGAGRPPDRLRFHLGGRRSVWRRRGGGRRGRPRIGRWGAAVTARAWPAPAASGRGMPARDAAVFSRRRMRRRSRRTQRGGRRGGRRRSGGGRGRPRIGRRGFGRKRRAPAASGPRRELPARYAVALSGRRPRRPGRGGRGAGGRRRRWWHRGSSSSGGRGGGDRRRSVRVTTRACARGRRPARDAIIISALFFRFPVAGR